MNLLMNNTTDLQRTHTVALASADEMRARLRRQAHLKGRQADDASLQQVRALMGERPEGGHRRDLLIEHLHRLQDAYRGLHERHLVALAREMNLPMAEVFEVASFYHHFEILREGQTPAALTVRVCDGLSCEMQGAQALLQTLPRILGSEVRVIAAPCIGRCEQAPAVAVHQTAVPHATVDKVAHTCASLAGGATPGPRAPQTPAGHGSPTAADAADAADRRVSQAAGGAKGLPIPLGEGWAEGGVVDYDAYRAQEGYAFARRVAAGELSAEELIGALEDAGLRGLGGAGFPAGRKWRIVREQPAPRLMAVNIDEGEPGTFKDRTYLERDPHRFLEGMLIAAQVVGVQACYIYLRDEYHDCRALLQAELDRLRADPPCALPHIELRRGAGAYICGEESAMIESLEGKRGEPRMRPPYIAQVGLFGSPTLEHNFETLYWVRDIAERGAQWFSSFGAHGRKGLRSFSVSGRVRHPGVKLAPAGITLRELVDQYCGGMAEGHTLYAYLPGGASGGILPARLADIPLDFDTLQPYGCFIGSAAVIVLSQHDRARDAARNMMNFFAHESCGQCTPCRVGTAKAAALMQAPVWDAATLQDLSEVMVDASICGLGQAAPNPVQSVLRHFAHEVGGAA
jgi:formate dehydrogenase beta subunit